MKSIFQHWQEDICKAVMKAKTVKGLISTLERELEKTREVEDMG